MTTTHRPTDEPIFSEGATVAAAQLRVDDVIRLYGQRSVVLHVFSDGDIVRIKFETGDNVIRAAALPSYRLVEHLGYSA
jgi:hypothetical protein